MRSRNGKRASYREGVEIIALNDEAGELDCKEMVGMATVMLLAELFGKSQETVAADVVRFREKELSNAAAEQKRLYKCFRCGARATIQAHDYPGTATPWCDECRKNRDWVYDSDGRRITSLVD